jgi:DNA-binding CsgD family transcriptional regulator
LLTPCGFVAGSWHSSRAGDVYALVVAADIFDEANFRRAASDTMKMMRTLRKLRALFKTDGGHLTNAAKAVIKEGLRNGMTQSEIADLLSVSPAAISYHVR